MSRPTRPQLMTGLALLGALTTAGGATAEDSSAPDAVRTQTDNVFERKNGVLRNDAFAVTRRPGTNDGGSGKAVGSMTVTVNAATKSRYGLKSAVIMKGSTWNDDNTPSGSSGVVWRFKSTRAVGKKLKGVKKLKNVTYKLEFTSPVAE